MSINDITFTICIDLTNSISILQFHPRMPIEWNNKCISSPAKFYSSLILFWCCEIHHLTSPFFISSPRSSNFHHNIEGKGERGAEVVRITAFLLLEKSNFLLWLPSSLFPAYNILLSYNRRNSSKGTWCKMDEYFSCVIIPLKLLVFT